MPHHPSVDLALDALQRRAEALERELAERTAELERVQGGMDVEAALDRVRTQAMGVQHSDETGGVAIAIVEALRGLGLPVLQVGLSGPASFDDDEVTVWVASLDTSGETRASHFVAALAGHPVLDAVREAGRTGRPLVERMARGTFEAYLRAFAGRYPPSYAERVVARAPRSAEYHYVYVPVETRQTGHLYAVLAEAPTEATLEIVRRYSVLFNQAYARFLDLQRAEVQARTSQIEAALERVRARALAMRRSTDLADVLGAVFQELDGLGVRALRSGVGVMAGPADGQAASTARPATFWTTLPRRHGQPVGGAVRLDRHPFAAALTEAWRQQKDYSHILEGDALRAAYERLNETLPASDDPAAPRAREYFHAVPYAAGVLYAFAERPFAEDTVQVMQRLARALHFAFTRHLDLQQAEAQAREAVQQASVDRVRAEIASMRTVADLDRITPLVWHELTALGVPFFRCGVFIVEPDAVQVFLATPEGDAPVALRLPFGSHPLVDQIGDHWRRQEMLADRWDGAQIDDWTRVLEAHGVATSLGAAGETAGSPVRPLALHLAPFEQGMLFVGSAEPLPLEDRDVVQALADAFEVAYARYDDFQRLDARKQEVEATLAELRATQQQLVQSEKLASLGALTAGIAHEIKNPLNFVINFSSLSRELADELAEGLAADALPADLREVVADLRANVERIEGHGRRADSIVRGMMQHARGGEGAREAVDLNALVEESVGLAFHGKRAQTPDFNVTTERDYDVDVGLLTVVPQEIGRVLINLLNNAFDAVRTADTPTVRVSTARVGNRVEVRVADNGTGMSEAVRARVFEPFFTTKPAGQGTGLGLSMSYDIVVQGHGGSMGVESAEGEGTTFVITLPLDRPPAPA